MTVTTVSAAFPAAQVYTLDDSDDRPAIAAKFPNHVFALRGEVHTPWGCNLSAHEAAQLGATFLAAAWWAGYRPTTAGDDLVVLPDPITPEWAPANRLSFRYPTGYVYVVPDSGVVEVACDCALDAEEAWHTGLAVLAAGRYTCLDGEGVAA